MRGLAALLLELFNGLFALVAKWLGKKIAFYSTAIAAWVAVVGAFYVTTKALVNWSASQITNDYALMGFYACWPDNAELCISACIGADVAAFFYRYRTDLIRLVGTNA